MNNALGLIAALEQARKTAHTDQETYWVYPLLSHTGETLWGVDHPDNSEEIEAEERIHPDCRTVIAIGPRGEVSYIPRSPDSPPDVTGHPL